MNSLHHSTTQHITHPLIALLSHSWYYSVNASDIHWLKEVVQPFTTLLSHLIIHHNIHPITTLFSSLNHPPQSSINSPYYPTTHHTIQPLTAPLNHSQHYSTIHCTTQPPNILFNHTLNHSTTHHIMQPHKEPFNHTLHYESTHCTTQPPTAPFNHSLYHPTPTMPFIHLLHHSTIHNSIHPPVFVRRYYTTQSQTILFNQSFNMRPTHLLPHSTTIHSIPSFKH